MAEDNSTNRIVAVNLLQSLGCKVQAVHNGIQALNAVHAAEFDLIFMDWSMPEMDGVEATHRIRKDGDRNLNAIPIIALTANDMAGDRERCLAAGMDDYVTKPFRRVDLQQAIERVMAARPRAI